MGWSFLSEIKNMANVAVRFKLIGPNADKTIALGPKNQYAFVKGICEFECPPEDASKHAKTLAMFYSAKRVKPSKEAAEAVEEVLPEIDEADEADAPEEAESDEEDDAAPSKKASSKKTK
jgi:hypothetical protein